MLPMPKIRLHAQFGLPIHKSLNAREIFSQQIVRGLRRWCSTHGVCPNAWGLPYLHLGPFPC